MELLTLNHYQYIMIIINNIQNILEWLMLNICCYESSIFGWSFLFNHGAHNPRFVSILLIGDIKETLEHATKQALIHSHLNYDLKSDEYLV